MFDELNIHDVQLFYVNLGEALVKHHDGRLNLFYMLQYNDSRCRIKNDYNLLLHKLDFSSALDLSNTQVAHHQRLVNIQRNLSNLLDYVRYTLDELQCNDIKKNSYRHLITLMKRLDRSIETFRKEISNNLTYLDELTGLLNRSAMEKDLTELIDLNNEQSIITSLSLIDIDHFKLINDEYGHAVGDEILESIADIIQSSLRDTDSAYRYGGEEILIVLKDSPIDDSVAAMQRLREKISDYVFISYEIELSVTVSIGVTPIKSSDKVSRDTLIRADECLYSAKDNGRNQVVYKI
ncbi:MULTISPECIES: GGDEF domain-containing protein [unclassified Pseudoalteromonas]|jgi:diguanylate cyclase (GGDEF)-like protein|uniref:GGDEF domain-containing protein n=1 Tax=unclassified Pseudoalteromonas TaxID=194690 RepID=UPI0003FC320A|nr:MULTISPECIES: GGDEF domain-containing protein [unclassified Pseudoalteromonas]TMP85099.1 GGDEF domain-containing protein [Pseudoalteromonas sp. S983]USN27035.1 GGDEF domain-containing protein [synthetic construct]|tara:strand:+ start:13034 stop:13915 length:882 start_codon:yes stop_codon:yes gene_type:complete